MGGFPLKSDNDAHGRRAKLAGPDDHGAFGKSRQVVESERMIGGNGSETGIRQNLCGTGTGFLRGLEKEHHPPFDGAASGKLGCQCAQNGHVAVVAAGMGDGRHR
jgi:hypothetical protein